jgi:4-alpha-glucanotransferase
MTDKLHEAFIRTLLEAKPCWTIFVISDILGVDWRFNQPGTSTDDNWSQRLDRPLAEYSEDLVYGPKIRFMREEIGKTQRAP